MDDLPIRSVFPSWPGHNDRLRDRVAALTEDQLQLRPSAERWPLWATIGHLACQRISWLCGEGGEPGAETTPFPDALYRCPGDEYLEPAMSGAELAAALDSTFAIVERCLATWTLPMLDDVVGGDGDATGGRRRGFIIERVFGHDVYHLAEINEILGRSGLAQIDPWA